MSSRRLRVPKYISSRFRRYGRLYRKTAHLSNQELAALLVTTLSKQPGLECGIAFHREGCMEITLRGVLDENSPDEFHLTTGQVMAKSLSQYGWWNPADPTDRRFDSCALILVYPSETPPHLGEVLVTDVPCPHRR